MDKQSADIEREILSAELARAQLERDAARTQLQQLHGSRSWRWSAPLRYSANIWRHGRLAFTHRGLETNAVQLSALKGLAQTTTLEPQRTLLCFANIAWEARFQRPQQLMSQFAEQGWTIFYIVPSNDALEGQAYSTELVATNVQQIKLPCPVPHHYYSQMPDANTAAAYRTALDALIDDHAITHAWSVVQLPYWTPLALGLPFPTLYDCMDDWDGFPHIGKALLQAELQLVEEAELVTVSAGLLHTKWVDTAKVCQVIRNAVDFDFFVENLKPSHILGDCEGPIIGYYGALASWFDFALLAEAARLRPDWTFVLVGDVFVDDLGGLDRLPNVRLEGRKPYAQMPLYLQAFDVCLIPFLLNNVTHAVDPVKLYEYLSAGKPVVSVPLEEILHYHALMYFATNAQTFVDQINRALQEPPAKRAPRIAMARDNTWRNRFEETQRAMVAASSVSIIVVTYNNLALTAQCLESLARNTCWPEYQVIVVDNGSQDATALYLTALRDRMPGLEVILNAQNLGFAAANNQGLRQARGDILVLLNNDTVVPKGWLKPLVQALQDTTVGMVGPVTNNVGNEARIQVDYSDIADLQPFADRHSAAHAGQSFDIPMLAMFCVALRRDVMNTVGELDEQFGVGLFEDDDYSRRVQAAGLRTVCVESAYVHHYGQSAFKALIDNGQYQALWDRNQAYFESKWGTWQAHSHRGAAAPTPPPTSPAPSPMAAKPTLEQRLRNFYYRLPLHPGTRHRLGRLYRALIKPAIRPARQAVAALSVPMDRPALATRDNDLPDYFVWGVIDWHFRHQRPQQLAKVLASQGHRVFYISSNLLDRHDAGFDVEALDTNGRLFQIQLFSRNPPTIYHTKATEQTVRQLHASLGLLLQWVDSQANVSLVNHPFWTPIARALPNHCMVYDCMDNHEGFGNDNADLQAMEYDLLARADLTVFTSTWLEETLAAKARRSCVVRNAADYSHFAKRPETCYRDSEGRRIIGYYGAIAHWFDLDVVAAIAERFKDCCILLVGADTVQASRQLKHFDNVLFTGEVPYAQLPHYLYGFDVCLLPFRVIPLTQATNPVKVYEYLSAGKPVVCTALPEMQQFGPHVQLAHETVDYLDAIAALLHDDGGRQAVEARQAFAREQTWEHRAQRVMDAVHHTFSDAQVSVIVVTYNNLPLTRLCLASLESDDCVKEVIVVDNASSDGTPQFLEHWAQERPGRRCLLNDQNRGFSAANNQGLAVATGSFLMLLNNDAVVTPGALRTLQNHLQQDPTIGLIGPVTNNIGNEAKINIDYTLGVDMESTAARYTRSHCGQTFSIPTLAFFAAMMPRSTYERLGPLDETFGIGFFEDDDYCRRIEQTGLRLVCAEDAFIHHRLSASFDEMNMAARQALFNHNKALYEAKWGQWQSHTYRT